MNAVHGDSSMYCGFASLLFMDTRFIALSGVPAAMDEIRRRNLSNKESSDSPDSRTTLMSPDMKSRRFPEGESAFLILVKSIAALADAGAGAQFAHRCLGGAHLRCGRRVCLDRFDRGGQNHHGGQTGRPVRPTTRGAKRWPDHA